MAQEKEEELESAGPIPPFAYVCGTQTFLYDFVHRSLKESSVPWLRRSICRDVHMTTGWLLLQDLDTLQLSMFLPRTYQRILLPIPQIVRIEPRSFTCRFASRPPQCHVIAIHKALYKFFIYCSPNGRQWSEKYSFKSVPNFFRVEDAILYQGKIWAMSNPESIMCIDFTMSCSDPIVSFLQFKMINPPPYSLKLCDSYLVKTAGEIYAVQVYNHDDMTFFPGTVVVLKLRDRYAWETVESIGNKAFLLGDNYSASISTNGQNGNMIYFSTKMMSYPCSFNMQCRRLTRHFDDEDWDSNVMPYWLLLGYEHRRKHREAKETIKDQLKMMVASRGDEYCHFERYKRLLSHTARDPRGVGIVLNYTWSPQTPWLMVMDRYDSKFKLVDPCTDIAYELDIPELSSKQLCYSKNGWIMASGSESISFYNPFTNEKMDVSSTSFVIGSISLSSSPKCPDCLVFSIIPEYTGGDIYLLRLSDKSVTHLKYTNLMLMFFTYSSPVYYNGLFYCLCLYGNLGVYNPLTNSWDVQYVFLPSSTVAFSCFLIECDGELLSVFLDKHDYPIGVFSLDTHNGEWKKVENLLNRTLFVGVKASFIVPAPEPRMANKIYLPQFKQEKNCELLSHDAGKAHIFEKSFVNAEYLHIWIEPKNLRIGLDEIRGKISHPVIQYNVL